MVDPTGYVTALHCVDGRNVVIGSAYIDSCQLFQSLPSQPDEIAVPFSEEEISLWRTYCEISLWRTYCDAKWHLQRGFLEYMSVIEV